MADLKPCPFCGGKVKIIPEQVDARTVAYNFVCQNGDCCANVYFDYSDREESIEAWNTRKPMEEILDKIEEVRNSPVVESPYNNGWQTCADVIKHEIEIVRGKE